MMTRLILGVFLSATVAVAQPWSAIGSERIFEAIGVREGSTVCEMGAGDGEMTLAARRAVGATGRVFTSELGSRKLEALRKAVDGSGLAHITVVDGHEDKTNFAEAVCDALFMRDVYHHLTSPARMNPSVYASLKPGGRVAIVDFTPPGEEAMTPADRGKDGMHGVHPDTVAHEMKQAGFELVSTEKGDRWFLAVFSKPNSASR